MTQENKSRIDLTRRVFAPSSLLTNWADDRARGRKEVNSASQQSVITHFSNAEEDFSAFPKNWVMAKEKAGNVFSLPN